MHSLTSAGPAIDEAERGDLNRRSHISLLGPGGLSIIRLKQETYSET